MCRCVRLLGVDSELLGPGGDMQVLQLLGQASIDGCLRVLEGERYVHMCYKTVVIFM